MSEADPPIPGADRPGAQEGDPLLEAVAVMDRIRRLGRWESTQTHASLLPYLVEESWELVDAVDGDDRDELVSELGDLLLQVLFHAAIGAEREDRPFDVRDVARSMLDKLRRRAPYWFDHTGDAGAPDAAEQDRLWQEAKAAERAEAAKRSGAAETSAAPEVEVLRGVSWSQPALALGQKVLERAAAAGVPDDLVPESMRTVTVTPGGVFGGSASAELDYRERVRDFARRVEAAARLLGEASAPAERWREVWPAG